MVMNFMEAVKAMKEGKKVRSSNCVDSEKSYYFRNNFWEVKLLNGFDGLEQDACLTFKEFESTDWEIYKEEDNWNLADFEVIQFSGALVSTKNDKYAKGKGLFFIKDFKTFIQKVKEDISVFSGDKELNEIIDKRAGNL